MHAIRLTVCAALCVAALGSACGGGSTPQESSAPAAAVVTNPVDPATAGAISGAIELEGTPPANPPINMGSDPYCMKQGAAVTPTFVVSGDGLQNVFIYVKDGLGNLKFPVPATAVTLDQKGCAYTPRVFGIQVGQSLDIVNSDETLHNIHALPMANREFNRGQALQGMKYTTVFTTPEVMLPFKCDVHKWMNAWVGVVDHPFYAVSGAGGRFEIKGLPPGTYTIEAWHEKLGTQTQMVTVGAKEAKAISFTFKI
ncbi:MAG TPA: carboxypeptidase regulatory-like domain-containing protein [Vicinamibacterales bacterium]|nr:carboxypeptidase regulatory-like domain-containing protein [Vicinamibacterales bacterium]